MLSQIHLHKVKKLVNAFLFVAARLFFLAILLFLSLAFDTFRIAFTIDCIFASLSADDRLALLFHS